MLNMSELRREADLAEGIPYTPDFDRIFTRSEPTHTPSPMNTSSNNPPVNGGQNQSSSFQASTMNPSPPNVVPMSMPQANTCSDSTCQLNLIQRTSSASPRQQVAPVPPILPNTPSPSPVAAHAATPIPIRPLNPVPTYPIQPTYQPVSIEGRMFAYQQQIQAPQLTVPTVPYQPPLVNAYGQIVSRPEMIQRANAASFSQTQSWLTQPNPQLPTQQTQQIGTPYTRDSYYNPTFQPRSSATTNSLIVSSQSMVPQSVMNLSNQTLPNSGNQNVRERIRMNIQANSLPRFQQTNPIPNNPQLSQMLSNQPQFIYSSSQVPVPAHQMRPIQSSIAASSHRTYSGPRPRQTNANQTQNRPPPITQRNVINPNQTIISTTNITPETTVSCLNETVVNSAPQPSQTISQQPPVSVSSTTRATRIPKYCEIAVQVEPERSNKACQFDGRSLEMVSKALNAIVETKEVDCQVEDDLPPLKTYVDRASSPIQFHVDGERRYEEPTSVPVRRKFTAKRKKANDVPVQRTSDSDSDIISVD